jgi:nucleotide-binding universal stress UspA family protein
MKLGSRTHLSLRSVLFATDFSPCSEAAMPYGIGMARRYDSTMYTVSVVSSELTYDIHVQPPDPFYRRHSAEKKMEKVSTSGVLQGIKHVELVEEGFDSVSRMLLDFVVGHDIDLIVLGMHGCGGIRKLVVGSVAEEIVNSAPCPVLTVGPHVPPKSTSELELQRILCATTLQPSSAKTLAYALALAADEHAHLILLHVLSADHPSQDREAEKDLAMKQVLQLIPPETSPSARLQPIVAIGAPAEHIPKVAEDVRADLIVIGPPGTFHPRISAHLPWALLHQVLSHARCPVLRV